MITIEQWRSKCHPLTLAVVDELNKVLYNGDLKYDPDKRSTKAYMGLTKIATLWWPYDPIKAMKNLVEHYNGR
jgi:hypothetical protein